MIQPFFKILTFIPLMWSEGFYTLFFSVLPFLLSILLPLVPFIFPLKEQKKKKLYRFPLNLSLPLRDMHIFPTVGVSEKKPRIISRWEELQDLAGSVWSWVLTGAFGGWWVGGVGGSFATWRTKTLGSWKWWKEGRKSLDSFWVVKEKWRWDGHKVGCGGS